MLKEIDLFGLHLQTFGIFFALNFICWAAVVARRLKEIGKPVDWAYEVLFAALIGGLVGARGYFLLQNWDELDGSVLSNLVSGSGLIWYGGLVGGVIAVLIWAKWRNFLSMELPDLAAIGLPLGYAIGRIGCQISGDGDYGHESTLPWAMGFPHGVVPTEPGVLVEPTPLYETWSMGLFALVLWNLRDHFRPGTLFGIYLVGAGIERFLVEFARRNEPAVGFMTAAQVESLVLVALGVVWLFVIRSRNGGRFRAATPRADRRRRHRAAPA